MGISRRDAAYVGGALQVAALIAACGLHAESMMGESNGTDDKVKREQMVVHQMQRRDITSREVLDAMRAVPRHAFVPDNVKSEAYADWPLPIGEGQTISQPYIVAYMTQALAIKKGDKVLEIGTGSGYQAAVLAEMGAEVYSVEIVEPLGRRAADTLQRLGYKVHVKIGDGYDGWPKKAPFDGIIVTAAPKKIPAPLVSQLKEGGHLVIPVGTFNQTLEVYTKTKGELVLQETLPVRFVPMTGKAQ
jgi:protein-L-isoaspartate(D-aspartate) O-methyltransferase